MSNKSILKKANKAVSDGDYELFLSFCATDSNWVFIGDMELEGIDAIRQYILEAYLEQPRFNIYKMIAEGDFVSASGRISLKQMDGNWLEYQYCDVWEFKDGKLFKLKAFVI